MTAVDNLVQANSKDELVSLAAEYELDTTGTKAELAERIVKFETGVSPEAEISEPEPEPVDDTADEEQTLVKYTGKSRHFESHGQTFKADTPFKLVPDSVADALFDAYADLFRPASRKQVEEFYS